MKYFNNCKTLNEVKSLYRILAKANHPDLGGSTVEMQMINAEYSEAIKKVYKDVNPTFTEEEVEKEVFVAEQFKDAVNAIIHLPGIIIEICGSWIWVTGNTYKYKDILKSNKFLFASKKVAWYFRPDDWVKVVHKPIPLDKIRDIYGSKVLKGNFTRELQDETK